MTRRFVGEDVVLYRTDDGELHAVHPYCPHLGAHLGGGRVEGQNLVCPFHRFAFAPDGRCAHAPGGPAPRARLSHHTVSERNGFIFIWHEHRGASPSWHLPQEFSTEVPPTAVWTGEALTHVQEVTENAVDYRHLPVMHGVTVQERIPPTTEGPFLRLSLRLTPQRFPAIGKVVGDYAFQMAGLGCFRTETNLPPLGLVVYTWAMFTPTEPRRTRLLLATACTPADRPHHSVAWITRHSLHRCLARAVLWAGARALRQDMPVFNTKRYEPRPRLAAGDEAIGLYRHWARQFYPDIHGGCSGAPTAPDGATPQKTHRYTT
ncbi:Rieske 2Fe-2S domain-containing protein [Streptomyces stramineus]|uniref:Rieske-type oxygenase n=2 Tax=Streptomyces TaxID=1883 RepID=A0ABP3J6X0_9ACTN